jgi:hypothetical protein
MNNTIKNDTVKAVMKLPDTLSKLIASKSLRDNKAFTSSKLATAINANRSLIHRLITGEVLNPRIETISKIVKFFKEDGFNLRIEDLVGIDLDAIDVHDQFLQNEKPFSLPLYQMENFNGEKIGSVSVELANTSPSVIAIVSNRTIKPLFQAGSIFVVDLFKKPKHEHLVAAKSSINNKLFVRKYFEKDGEYPILHSFNKEEKDINLAPNIDCKIIGVIIKINAKT